MIQNALHLNLQAICHCLQDWTDTDNLGTGIMKGTFTMIQIKYLPTRDSQQHSKVFHLWHKDFKTLSRYFIRLILKSFWVTTNLSTLFFYASFGCADFSEGWASLSVAEPIEQSYWWKTENSKGSVVHILLNQNQDRSLSEEFLCHF